MAVAPRFKAKTAHVNMMTDTIIANLPDDTLRSVVRAILTVETSVTPIFEEQARQHLQRILGQPMGLLFTSTAGRAQTTPEFALSQQRIRSAIGCGLVFESLPLLKDIVDQSANLLGPGEAQIPPVLDRTLASVDGDIVQALTAVQKRLLSSKGSREFTAEEKPVMHALLTSMLQCRELWLNVGEDFPFERGISVMATMLCDSATTNTLLHHPTRYNNCIVRETAIASVETFPLRDISLPRLFSGLWQLSSPSWGVASQSQMFKQFAAYIGRGFTAFDMADHYGDAEVIFGRLRASLPHPSDVFGATKYCVFHNITVTPQVIRANVTERCRRMGAEKVDLLQFHWQDYNDRQYIRTLQLLQQDERVRYLGLCNFDTDRLHQVIESGVDIVTNQVQFSLIDARPRFRMDVVCEKYNVKLLTYGTLCGGFLADRWLGKPEPHLFGSDSTPSQRKYFEMIQTWGDWQLFQKLLHTLKCIANKHKVTISNVATRWVLDFPYVGAVIVGARMGVSEHTEENLETYGWHLDEDDQRSIECILMQSRREEVFKAMGDCGSEYR